MGYKTIVKQLDCQQPASSASVLPLSPQLRRARASLVRSPSPNIVTALQEDQTPPFSSSRNPLDPLNGPAASPPRPLGL
ncbi:hypothetical protein J4Q44_G00090940 [Coregonus suidteri]|uniref:Uncharacterized protein n=1 Tax=Coregonus suidteri TaxID=861788 RepID=A0AAN8RAR9_9TELE